MLHFLLICALSFGHCNVICYNTFLLRELFVLNAFFKYVEIYFLTQRKAFYKYVFTLNIYAVI